MGALYIMYILYKCGEVERSSSKLTRDCVVKMRGHGHS